MGDCCKQVVISWPVETLPTCQSRGSHLHGVNHNICLSFPSVVHVTKSTGSSEFLFFLFVEVREDKADNS